MRFALQKHRYRIQCTLRVSMITFIKYTLIINRLETQIKSLRSKPKGPKVQPKQAMVICTRGRITIVLLIFTLFRKCKFQKYISNKRCQCLNTDYWADDTPRNYQFQAPKLSCIVMPYQNNTVHWKAFRSIRTRSKINRRIVQLISLNIINIYSSHHTTNIVSCC